MTCPICKSTDEPRQSIHRITLPERGTLTILWCTKCTAALGKEFRCED